MQIAVNKRIGIWGFGIVGRAIASYFLRRGYVIGIMDHKKIDLPRVEPFCNTSITWFLQTEKEDFFAHHDLFFVSPGINISDDYERLKSRIINELDFFQSSFKKPIIAITGSIGKTSITHCLAQIMAAAHIPTFVGGNIGTATFEGLDNKYYEQAVLEASSFQLNYCATFAPDLAIVTNMHPNHLDYHGTEERYFAAKYNIMKQQRAGQRALISLELRHRVEPGVQKRSYFTTQKVVKHEFNLLRPDESLYYIERDTIIRYRNGVRATLFALSSIPLFTFIDNLLILVSVCDILAISLDLFTSVAATIQLPEHRCEFIPTNTNIFFYNDSKGTTPVSTYAAVEKFKKYKIHLFLGGLSKGVDRAPLIKQLRNKIAHIYCFGAEADELYTMCLTHKIPAYKYTDLVHAFNKCISHAQEGDCVLFSPSGSSYDLYKDYQERGNHFKKLVLQYATMKYEE